MATCPNCGEIVMDGDSYCSHCGSTLRWNSDDDAGSHDESDDSYMYDLFDQMLKSGLSTDERLELFEKYLFLTDSMREVLKESIRETETLYKCRFIMPYTKSYPVTYIFFRQDTYRDVMIFERCYVEYDPGRFDPDQAEIHYLYNRLYASEKFRREVARIEREGLKFTGVQSEVGVFHIPDDVITACFTDGDDYVFYRIDDDLNFKRTV